MEERNDRLLRVLLLALGLQKACDAAALHPPIAVAVLRLLGLESAAPHDPMLCLLARLWGCASLVWSYSLLKASRDPRGNRIAIEASILGFAAAGLVGVLTPPTPIRAIGLLFLAEAALLLVGRLRIMKKD